MLIFILFFLPKFVDVSEQIPNFPENIVQMTIFFHTFVLMQVFNSISSRQLDESILNPFKNICNNGMFWFVQTITIVVQYALIYYGGQYVQVVRLNLQQHLLCLAFSLVGMPLSVVIKLLPSRWFSRWRLFQEGEVEEDKMDESLPSRLRKRSTIRLHTINKDMQNSQSKKSGMKSSKNSKH